jgi:carboxyl-terminal processing protease
VPQALVDSILADGKKQKIEPKDEKELQQTLPYLKTQLKALVARDIWDMNEYFQIINEKNKIISKALQIISKEQ